MTDPLITGLSDGRAVQVLELVLDRQGTLVDGAELRRDQDHLAEALPGVREEGLVVPEAGASAGDLARTALQHVADSDLAGRELVARAAAVADGGGEREPVTLAVGALVLLAFRTDLRLDRDPVKGWTLKIHTRPLSDSAVGKILGQLMGTYLKP